MQSKNGLKAVGFLFLFEFGFGVPLSVYLKETLCQPNNWHDGAFGRLRSKGLNLKRPSLRPKKKNKGIQKNVPALSLSPESGKAKVLTTPLLFLRGVPRDRKARTEPKTKDPKVKKASFDR